MKLLNLTLDEMERIAYIEGRTAEAAVLGALLDEIEELKEPFSERDLVFFSDRKATP